MGSNSQRKYREESLETGEPDPVEDYPSETKVVAGSLWMGAISVILFFLPVAGGILAGVIGGFRVGNARSAMTAAAGALIIVTFLQWMLLTLVPIPILGAPSSQSELALLIFLSDAGLLIGAAIGGTVAQNKIDRLNRA